MCYNMVMKVKVRRIGSSLGVILPRDRLEELGVREGDTVILRRIEKPAKEIKGILKRESFRFKRAYEDHDRD